MAILIQESNVHLAIGVRRAPPLEPGTPRIAYGLRLLCRGRPLWNPALLQCEAGPTGDGWLWDTAIPGPSLLEVITTALRDGRTFRWETRPGGIYLFAVPGAVRPELDNNLKYFFDGDGSVMVMVGIGSSLLAPSVMPSSSGLGWRLGMTRVELRNFAADLRREWQQLEV